MRPRLLRPTQLLEALTQRVVRVMGRRVDLEKLGEGIPRPVVLAGVVEGPAERLQDRRLAGLDPRGTLQDDRGSRVMPVLQQLVAALEQLVG